MLKPKGILIDLDDTIYPYEENHKLAIKSLFHVMKLKGVVTDFDDFLKRFRNAKKYVKKRTENQGASHNRLLYIQNYLETIGQWDPALSLELYEAYWGAFLSNMEIYEDALRFLKKHINLPIWIVTDLTAHIQYRKIIKLGISSYISGMTSSEEAGVEKPSPGIFEHALEKLNLEPTDVIFIGDNYKKDILGATRMNIYAFHLSKNSTEISENSKYKIVSSFDEISRHLY